MQLEGHVLDHVGTEVPGFQHHGGVGGHIGMALGLVEDDAAHHHLHDLVDGGLGGVHRVHVLAVAHDRDPVGDLLEFVHAVGDVDNAHARGLEPPDKGEEVFDFGGGQGGGRLIHDEDFRVVVGEGLGDFHHLLLGHGEPLDHRAGGDVQMEGLQKLVGLAVLFLFVQEQALGGLASHEDVLRHGQVLHQVQLLVHDADAQLLGVAGGLNLGGLAVELDDAVILGVNTGENFHQRRFTGAVLTDEGQDFAGAQLQLRVVQCVDAGEILLNPMHIEQNLRHSSISLLYAVCSGQKRNVSAVSH